MKEKTKRRAALAVTLFALMLGAGLLPEGVSAEEAVLAPESVTFMEPQTNYAASSGYFRVENVTPYTYVDADGIVSSDPEVVEVNRVETVFKRDGGVSFSDIFLDIRGAGTAEVSYRAGGLTFQTRVIVKEYENPIKYLSMTNVNGGNDFSLFEASKAFPPGALVLGDTTKRPELKLEAANGWAVRSVYLNCSGQGSQPLSESYILKENGPDVSTRSFRFTRVNKVTDPASPSASLSIGLNDELTGQTVTVSYEIY